MKIQSRSLLLVSSLGISFFLGAQVKPGPGTQELADKLSGTFSNLINLPLRNKLHHGIGAYNGLKYTINVIDPILPVFNKDSNF